MTQVTEAGVRLTRRQFGKAAGSLVVAFTLAPRLAGAQAPQLPGSLANNRMLNAWLRINADGSATIFTGKVELGQGIPTALAQIAADELDLHSLLLCSVGRIPSARQPHNEDRC